MTFVRYLAEDHHPCLWITDRAFARPPDGSRTLRVSTLASDGSVDPKRLGDLRAAAAAFAADVPAGLVLLDCLEYLVLHNGAERVLRALADLHDDVTMHGGSLVVFVDSRVANPRLVAWLERELDPLPAAEVVVRQADGLSA